MGIPNRFNRKNGVIVVDLKIHRRRYESEEDTIIRLTNQFKTAGMKTIILFNEKSGEQFIVKLD